jgi:hypothetical protein
MDDKWLQWRMRPKTPARAGEVTAQELYAALVKEVLSPGLRGLRLKGSGGRYSLDAPNCWALLSLQKSTYSDAAEAQFTVDLLVANRADWAAARVERPYLPERPSASTTYGEPAIDERIGMLTPEPADKWWRVYPGFDQSAVPTDVLDDIQEFAIPSLSQQLMARGHTAEQS